MRSTPSLGLSAADKLAYGVVTLCMAEGAATEFISGPPAGRVPALSVVPFHVFTPDLAKSWDEHVGEEEQIVEHQAALLDKAVAGRLTQDAFDDDLRNYWLNGAVGRAYILGSDMFGAIYTAFGKKGVFAAMRDPRQFFDLYNKALDAKPKILRRCVRMPDRAVKQALAIGREPQA